MRPLLRLVFSGLILVVVGFGLFQNRLSIAAFQEWADSFGQPLIRDAYQVLSDVARLEHSLDQVYHDVLADDLIGPVDLATSAEAQLALDLLWIRAEDFSDLVVPPSLEAERDQVAAALTQVIAQTDAVLVTRRMTVASLDEIHATVDKLRLVLTNLVEEWRTMDVRTIAEKNAALRKSVLRSDVFILASGMLVVAVMSLLSREIAARRAQQAAEAKARRLAYTDSLTEIPNRHAYSEEIEAWFAEYTKRGTDFTLALIDLDKFKEVNDTLGHAIGDQLLKVQAARIRMLALSRDGFASRLSGDEFAVLLPFHEDDQITAFCKELHGALSKPVETGAERIISHGTIGLCAASDISCTKMRHWEEMQRAADYALYAAKKEQRGTYRRFDAVLKSELNARQVLLTELPDAIKNGEITPFFQPKVDLASGLVIGFEALARWQRGATIIPPSDFIPLVEEVGFIERIDLAVLRKAATEVASHNLRHGTRYAISSNLSAKHFTLPDMVSQIQNALSGTGLPMDLLTLEITESIHLSDWDRVGKVIGQLRGLGCRISIDDFGTGFSSLSYLRAVMADEVKIDRSFLEEIDASEEARFLLDTIIDMASGLNMDIVVEGIETQRQENLVFQMGCPTGQGYLYGEPVPIAMALDNATAMNARHQWNGTSLRKVGD